MALLLLVRHGRSTANTSGVLAGWTPGVSLDDTGRAGAGALAERMAPVKVSRIVSSPLKRCQETAAILAKQHEGRGVAVEYDQGLGECRYGAWTGRKIADLVKEPLWRTVQDTPSQATFPSGGQFPAESLRAMSDRATAAVRRIDAEVEARDGAHSVWVAVSHGDVIKALLAEALGLALDEFQRIVVSPGSLSVVQYTPKRAFVLRMNDGTADLTALLPTPKDDIAPGDATPGGATGADADGRAT
ncbi:MSMEG_4193 family putative phosphomutase [Leekyejoonella antrihumi]|uniref:MSMEG_4193 family putative phosphomutase n=1 Tax=Leekyejoonella antrihumi TaxID=1660198 RepID=A0A563DSR4_9MICO|nr:MSMEG_4193 family putative phosphomutase [Leekyejoonella antrihumi]TWP33216.1 MSMEG_4193 family putative phosphomutase [Leekyejoonella antrihumi]